ncbi:hypothetical protein NOF04DRAFT_1347288 [Fusarium oxysporum II5]|nr:hypothetical protein NOF04DRAFT_1347288 [Fusarium oxysporum II5]
MRRIVATRPCRYTSFQVPGVTWHCAALCITGYTTNGDDFKVRVTDMGELPVLITLTGKDSGLSQQPNLPSIDFITAQNQREIAVFGPQPDPLKSTLGFRNGLSVPPEDLPVVVSSLGGGDEPIEGPSSTWVDTTIHTGWPRVNAFDDERVYQWEEKRERWKLLREVAGVSLNYVRIHRRKSI